MSIDKFKRELGRNAASMDSFQGVARRGLVTNYDPVKFRAMVTYQPSGSASGWLPILSQWVGAGWGLIAPLQLNDQVLVLAEDGDSGNGVIVGRYYSEIDTPPQVGAAGEFWLVHQSGSTINLMADGTINMLAPSVNITGTLNVSADVVIAGKSVLYHYHPNVSLGGSNTPPMQG